MHHDRVIMHRCLHVEQGTESCVVSLPERYTQLTLHFVGNG